jgi:hypothetical protein
MSLSRPVLIAVAIVVPNQCARADKAADWAGDRRAFQVEDRRKLTWKLPNCVEPMAN